MKKSLFTTHIILGGVADQFGQGFGDRQYGKGSKGKGNELNIFLLRVKFNKFNLALSEFPLARKQSRHSETVGSVSIYDLMRW